MNEVLTAKVVVQRAQEIIKSHLSEHCQEAWGDNKKNIKDSFAKFSAGMTVVARNMSPLEIVPWRMEDTGYYPPKMIYAPLSVSLRKNSTKVFPLEVDLVYLLENGYGELLRRRYYA